MGCECSKGKPLDVEEKLLTESKQSKTKRTDGYERNGFDSSLTWYFDPEYKEDGNISKQLCNIIGSKNKKHIESALSSVDQSMKNDINAVCEYLITQKSSNASNTALRDECKQNIQSCESLERMIKVLEIYIKHFGSIKWFKATKSNTLFEAIHEKYTNKQILDDFHHLLLYHNTDKDFEYIYDRLVQKRIVIKINKSHIITRHYRDRSGMNSKQRTQLYFGYSESKDICIIKLLDRIYCFYVYSFDIGMRLKMTQKVQTLYYIMSTEEKTDLESEISKDAKLVCLSSILSQKQINLENVLGKNRLEMNRYVTHSALNVSIEGVIFFYKNTHKRSNEIVVNEGKECHEKEWFIVPKFEDLKQELTDNGICNIDKSEFDDLLMLSALHSKADYTLTLGNVRDISKHSMTEQHLLAIMVYCNFSSVQYELKQTYFRLKASESTVDFKKRHSVFGNLGRLLKEIITKYSSESTQKSRINTFYHSINIKSISKTLIKFRAPTSCSTSQTVLYNYSGINGTIIELNSGELDIVQGSKPKYFGCEFVSDFSIECEKLFIGQKDTMLELSSILNIKTCQNYQVLVHAWNIICAAFGEINDSWAVDRQNPFEALGNQNKKHLKDLVKRALDIRGVGVQPHLYGTKKKKQYKANKDDILLHLLGQFAENKHEMILFWFSEDSIPQLFPWIETLLDFMREDSCFCKDLTKKDDRRWVKLDLLSLFFPYLESVTIVDCPITDPLLLDIETFIKKLKIDPKTRHRVQKTEEKKTEIKSDANDEEDLLADIDVEHLVDQLHTAQKSHVSFIDPNFDDQCDYRQCRIKEIKILESYHEQNDTQFVSFVNDEKLRKVNRHLRSHDWKMKREKIMATKEGWVYRKVA